MQVSERSVRCAGAPATVALVVASSTAEAAPGMSTVRLPALAERKASATPLVYASSKLSTPRRLISKCSSSASSEGACEVSEGTVRANSGYLFVSDSAGLVAA